MNHFLLLSVIKTVVLLNISVEYKVQKKYFVTSDPRFLKW